MTTRLAPTEPGHTSQDPDEFTPHIREAEMLAHGPRDGHLHNEHWVVADVQIKPQWSKPSVLTVWSPCCGRPRQRLGHGYAFSCPACGWWWRYHYVPAIGSIAVSLGAKP